MKKVLLCPPKHFRVQYEINPWMSIQNQVNPHKAQKEYHQLKAVYKDLGLEVLEIDQKQELPDMVYAANFGFPKHNVFIKTNFKHSQRAREAELAKKYLKEIGYAIKELPKTIVWEGQGDLLTYGGKYFLGWGKRTDKKAKKYLSAFLENEIIDLELVDPYYYHLDTCFLPLDDKTAAINPLSFEREGLETIKKHFPRIIKVSQADNEKLACNAVVIGKTIVCGAGISQKLKNDYAKFGFSVKEVSMEEFRKGGGSVKCLTLEFYPVN